MAVEYCRAIAKIVAAQLAEAAGFDAVQESAVETLADLLLRYIGELGSASHAYAELAGRSSSNVHDLLLAFKDVGVSVQDLMTYAAAEEEIPFAHSVPHFPVTRRIPPAPSFAQKKETPPPHVPLFLPAFPDKHTHVATPVYPGRQADLKQQRLEASKARRQGEKALVQLSSRLAASGAMQAAAAPVPGADAPPLGRQQKAVAAAAAQNPYLAAPLWEDSSAAGAELPSRPEAAEAPIEDMPTVTASLLAPHSSGAANDEEPAPVPGKWSGWVAEAAVPAGPAGSGRERLGEKNVTFSLDWAAAAKRKALASVSAIEPEDAYSKEAPDPGAERQRKRKKGGEGARDSQQRRAEAILAAGAGAMELNAEPVEPQAELI